MYYYTLYVVHYLCIVVCYSEMTMKSGLFNELLIIVPKQYTVPLIFTCIVNYLNSKYIWVLSIRTCKKIMCHLSFLQVCSINGCVYHIDIVYFQKTFLEIKNFVPCTLKIVVYCIFQFCLVACTTHWYYYKCSGKCQPFSKLFTIKWKILLLQPGDCLSISNVTLLIVMKTNWHRFS